MFPAGAAFCVNTVHVCLLHIAVEYALVRGTTAVPRFESVCTCCITMYPCHRACAIYAGLLSSSCFKCTNIHIHAHINSYRCDDAWLLSSSCFKCTNIHIHAHVNSYRCDDACLLASSCFKHPLSSLTCATEAS
jgi:hypothetical protein